MSDPAPGGGGLEPTNQPFEKRRAGILLHPTSLPGPGGRGVIGSEARGFVDLLARCGFGVWQVLPLGPTHSDRSPYRCLSAFAGDARLIDLRQLAEEGWLESCAPPGPVAKACRQSSGRLALMETVWRAFESSARAKDREAFAEFVASQAHWLDDYALYLAIKLRRRGSSWWRWPKALRDRAPAALKETRRELESSIARIRFEQFVFNLQWRTLKRYANDRGVLLFGDMPMFTAHDSADVWAARHYFRLGPDGMPTHVAGVPPDGFSATGQRWGNPLYDWAEAARDDYRWWKQRMGRQLALFDLVRIDHFRGFQACWEIPSTEPNAVHGHWVETPGEALFESLARDLGRLPLVAEDLGFITSAVHQLRERFGFPGMRVVQFAFDGDPHNPYLPRNHPQHCVAYTATHDNDTTVGWYRSLGQCAQASVCSILEVDAAHMPWALVEATFDSRACLAVLPMQDALELDSRHRMNVPGVAAGNWRWRLPRRLLTPARIERLQALSGASGRT